MAGSCGGRLTADEGIIQSPNFPNSYPRNAVCVWVIELPENEVMKITFTDMNLERHGNCIHDYVEVRYNVHVEFIS